MRKIIFVVLLIVLVAVVAQFWEQVMEYLFWLLGLSAAGFGATKGAEKLQEIQEKEKKLDRDAEDRRKKAEALAKEDEEQKGKVEDWRKRKDRWKSRSSGGKPGGLILILCMLLMAAAPARAEIDPYADFTREELIEQLIEAGELLDEADQRLARETALKEEYRQLYLEAEEDLRAAWELSGQKDEIIAGQNLEIDFLQYRLERKNRAWGLTGGVTLTGKGAQWSLGVARKKGILSLGGGIGGGDSFSVWGSVTLWL